jgi:hypothetical protein
MVRERFALPPRWGVPVPRGRPTTTPGLLRLLSVALVGATALLWAVSFATVVVRQHAVDAVAGDAGPAFVAAQRIHADLSEADATVAAAFLAGGAEPAEQRAAFQRGIASATQHVIDLARAGGPPEVRPPLNVLASQIPVYTGLVDQARADNRLGHVIGAAYLRQASGLMQTTILPAADRLAAIDAGRIDGGYARATQWWHPVLVALAGVAALAGLGAVQLLLYRRTHRVLNVPLVAASLLVALATAGTLTAFSVQRARLADGRDHGFVPMTVVAQARVLGLRAWGDQSLSLIARGDGEALDRDADLAVHRLGYDPAGQPTGRGVLPTAASLAGPDAGTRAGLDGAWRAYQAKSAEIRTLVSGAGGFQEAVHLALGDGNTEFQRFDAAADTALTASERRFTGRLSAAGDRLGGAAAEASAALALAALLALAGLQVRINEYR